MWNFALIDSVREQQLLNSFNISTAFFFFIALQGQRVDYACVNRMIANQIKIVRF